MSFNLISWFEIPVYDLERAIKFYTSVFRILEFERTGFNGIPMAVFKSNSANRTFTTSGVLVQNKKVDGDGPILFFNANLGMTDILDRIENAGGKLLVKKTLIKNADSTGKVVIPKTLIDGNVGYFAIFEDTEGNKMALYSNS